MPNIEVKLRRGTEAEHNTFTGAEGEVTVDTTNDTLRVHDGSTAGGVRLAKLSEAGLDSIPNLSALGNVSGTSAVPVAIDIKDEDTMTSDSATALATQQSIKAYVDSQVTSAVSKYSTGWVNTDGSTTVANSATLSFTHSLGTTDLIITCYVADDASGTNSFAVSLTDISQNSQAVQVKDITTTEFTVQLGSQGTVTTNSSGVASITSLASKYIKIVAIG